MFVYILKCGLQYYYNTLSKLKLSVLRDVRYGQEKPIYIKQQSNLESRVDERN